MGYDYLICVGIKDKPNEVKTYQQFDKWCDGLIKDIVKNIPKNCIMEDVGVVQHGGSGSLSCIDLKKSQLGDDLEKMSKMEKYRGITFVIYHAYWDLTGLKIYELRNGEFKMLGEYDYENEELKVDEYLSFRPVFNEDIIRSAVKNSITEYFAGTVGDYECEYNFELEDETESEQDKNLENEDLDEDGIETKRKVAGKSKSQ